MITKSQKVRLGVFLTVGFILILLFAGIVAGSKLFERRDFYYIEFDDVSVGGLQVGGDVQYHGIKIGRVENIKIKPDNVSQVVVTISVQAGTPIKEDVKAQLVYMGITGLKAIELTGGSNEAKVIKPKSFIPKGSSPLENISSKAESIVLKIDEITSNLAAITGEANQKNIADILNQTNLILTDTRENLSGALSSLDKMVQGINLIADSTSAGVSRLTANANLIMLDTRQQVNKIGGHTDSLIVKANTDLDKITASINSSLARINQIVYTAQFDSLIANTNTISAKLASADLRQLVSDLNTTIVQTNSLVSNLDRTVTRGKTDFLETLESLREASENLNEFARQISENPSALLMGN